MSGVPSRRKLRFVCTALNAVGRPVPMFDPFFDEEAAVAPSEEQGPIELSLFGPREQESLPTLLRPHTAPSFRGRA